MSTHIFFFFKEGFLYSTMTFLTKPSSDSILNNCQWLPEKMQQNSKNILREHQNNINMYAIKRLGNKFLNIKIDQRYKNGKRYKIPKDLIMPKIYNNNTK